MEGEFEITVAELLNLYDCVASIQVENIFLSTQGYDFDSVSNQYKFLNRVFEPNRRWPKQGGAKSILLSHTDKVIVTLLDFKDEIARLNELQIKIVAFKVAQLALKHRLEDLVKAKREWELARFELERNIKNVNKQLDETLPMKSDEGGE